MSEEEQRDYDAFSQASVSVLTSSKRLWRALGDSKVSQSQPQDISSVRQARPQAVAKAQSVKSAQSDLRSVQLQSDQRQVQLRAPQVQANFPVLAPQGQGLRQGLGRPVVARRDDIDSLFNEEEFSVDLDNEAVLKEKQARSEVLDKVAKFCNLDRQDPQIQGYLAKPDSLMVPSRPPSAERTAEDQPFFYVPRNPEDPHTRVDISSGSASLTASQLID